MTTNSTPSDKCVGHAMYLELEKGAAVTQVLIMPEGVSSAHRETHLSIYRRRIMPATPRRTWRYAASPHRFATVTASTHGASATEAVEAITGFLSTYLVSLSDNGWKLRKDVITVEVTAEDLEDSRMGKTPYKVFGRVWKVRKKLGFPKEFIVLPEPATTF